LVPKVTPLNLVVTLTERDYQRPLHGVKEVRVS
jgi:hypothetical protein